MKIKSWSESFNSDAKVAIYLYLAFKGGDYAYHTSQFFENNQLKEKKKLKSLNYPSKANQLFKEMEEDHLLIELSDVFSEYIQSTTFTTTDDPVLPVTKKITVEPKLYAVNPNAIYLDSNYNLTKDENKELKKLKEKDPDLPIAEFTYEKYKRNKIFNPLFFTNTRYAWYPGILLHTPELTDGEIAGVLSSVQSNFKCFDYITILFVIKQYLIHGIARWNLECIHTSDLYDNHAIAYADLPPDGAQRKRIVEDIVDQELGNIASQRDSQIRNILGKIQTLDKIHKPEKHKQDKIDIQSPLIIFQFLTLERMISPIKPTSASSKMFRFRNYLDFVDALIEIDMSISRELMDQRNKK